MFRSHSSNPNIAVFNVDNTVTFELTSNGRRISNLSGIRRSSDLLESRKSSNASRRFSYGSRNQEPQKEFSDIKEESHSFLDNSINCT